MHSVVATLSGADRVGAARIAIGRGHRIVSALAIGPADRVDGGEIDYVKSHPADIGKPRDAILERAVPTRNRALAAGYHFIPRAIARPRPVDPKLKQLRSRQ